MPLLTLTEASIYSGYSPELLQYFSKNCPKYNENKKLNFQNIKTYFLKSACFFRQFILLYVCGKE